MKISVVQILRSVLLLIVILFSTSTFAQLSPSSVSTPLESQKASVSQTIGISDITVNYHRPGVKNRVIWGGLVPYDGGKPIPWRGGANQNTTITFQNDVTVEGKPLVAGTYGLHIIPSATEWIFIFSKNSTSWGSFSYRENEDALRVTVKPSACEFTEYLTYEFNEVHPEDVKLELRWEKIKAAVKIGVDVKKFVVENARRQLRDWYGFTADGYNSAAMFCLENNTNLEEALTWANQAVRAEPNFNTLDTKAQLLAKLGRKQEAEEASKAAYDKTSVPDLYAYGKQLLTEKKTTEAMEVFEVNYKKAPNDWMSCAGMARGYQATGDKAKATTNMNKAIELAPNDVKPRLQALLKEWYQ